MSELVITSKDELEKMLRKLIVEVFSPASESFNANEDERLNQKQAAKFLGITQCTLIRWKKNGLVPCEQLPGSTKVTYYKSQLKSIIQRNPGLLQAARK
jgi:hypothetical protein